ncbi:hypothetical protein DPM19_00410 [Actinomadura craniellae]|uniref:Uncharacterized protein n=1 Tax=Actinomadura craniellae TaxID=2231787 RepID=A0A365HCP0_9ACTN|nr:hypothetical protein [Actinomadura craniellae]RAY16686.1 hypothetical protein DPM19_00410 [Actinomadura craniellae]
MSSGRRPAARRPVFGKRTTAQQADVEVRGWHQIASRFSAPALLGRRALAQSHVVIYEDVFASGRCRFLLGDLIALADRDQSVLPRLHALLEGVCRDLRAAAETTGELAPLSQCMPGLYANRIKNGGRLDAWYLHQDLPLTLPGTGTTITTGQLRRYTLTANGRDLVVDLPAIIGRTRHALNPASRWLTAITQGDPTEPNIADPLCWLDFEHAGRNTLTGESANLLWYLMALGGWLVPRYQPGTYQRTLRLALSPHTAPWIEHCTLAKTDRHISVHYTWNTGIGRHAALTRALDHLATPSDAFLQQARAFLTLRILGVLPPALLSSEDLLLVLIKAAECNNPTTTLGDLFNPTPVPLTNRAERSDHRASQRS